ncbi:MAG: hypothetical protein LBU91_09285 [Bacteroidales bacterium]|jgi:hypothetical protein|nr:hypothetical protein [Bacteroidales bacterium]
MNKSQSNYFNMVKAVCDVLENNVLAWREAGPIEDVVSEVSELRKAVEIAASKQVENTPTGHTAAKEAARTRIEDELFNIGRRLRSYGRIAKDAVIEEQSKFSRSSLDRLSLNNLLSLARSIAALCKARAEEELRGFKIDADMIAKFELAVADLDKLAAHRDAVVDVRMENTSSIIDLLGKLREQLKTLDALVEGFVDDDGFLMVYFSARRVHDVKGRSRKKEGEME